MRKNGHLLNSSNFEHQNLVCDYRVSVKMKWISVLNNKEVSMEITKMNKK